MYEDVLKALQNDGFDTDDSMKYIEFDDIKSENFLEDIDEFEKIDDEISGNASKQGGHRAK